MAGRTYKFAEKEFLWPFGFGLSYTTFAFGEPEGGDRGDLGDHGDKRGAWRLASPSSSGSPSSPESPSSSSVAFVVPVRNTGARTADCVVQVYVAKADRGPDDARCALVDFARVEVPAGGEALARFDLPRDAFATVDTDGVRAVRPGRYVVTVADCAPVPCAGAAGRTPPVSFEIRIA